MFNVILVNPEIPHNTGNIIRLCYNCNCNLFLIRPLGFLLDNKNLNRAAMDYNDIKNIRLYDSLNDCVRVNKFNQIFLLTKFSKTNFFSENYSINDAFIFGNESSGISKNTIKGLNITKKVRIPMSQDSRSLNLSNTVSIVIFEAWRQNNFKNAKISYS